MKLFLIQWPSDCHPRRDHESTPQQQLLYIYYRANTKKRQKVDHSENGIVENTIQYVVRKCEYLGGSVPTRNSCVQKGTQ